MAWKGFVKESKSYMNHPDYSDRFVEHKEQLYFIDGSPDPLYPGWTMVDRRKEVIKFWRKFPRAWFRFYWSTFYDFCFCDTRYSKYK